MKLVKVFTTRISLAKTLSEKSKGMKSLIKTDVKEN